MTDTTPEIDALLPSMPTSSVSSPTRTCTPIPAAARKVGRRFAQVSPIVATYRKLEAARGDLEAARELARRRRILRRRDP